MRNIDRLTALLTQAQVDGLLVINNESSGQPDTQYLAGFSGSTSWLFAPARGKRVLFVDPRYHQRARAEVKGTTIINVQHGVSFAEAFLKHAREVGLRKIGFDSAMTTVGVYERLWTLLRPLELASLPDVMRQVRAVKDAEEIKLLARAAKITTKSFEQLLKKIRIGMTEIEVAAILEKLFYENGATGVAFETIVASGTNGAQPHALVSTKKLKVGELVTIDCGASYKGYMADMTRTVALGKEAQLSAKAVKMYDAVEAAQRAGKAALRPGVKAGLIDVICRESLKKAGLEGYFTHGTGHGVGLAVHELPVLGSSSETVLEPGMVVTVEPGVYIPKFGGVRIEDALVITKDGSINLTKQIPTKLLWIRK